MPTPRPSRVWSVGAALLAVAALAWWQQRASDDANHVHRSDAAQPAPVAAGSVNGSAFADFEHYVLSLSWLPQYCATDGRDDIEQCGTHGRYGFIVHGLWPQHERGYPENCSSDRSVAGRDIERMLDLMPSERLIRHEWAKHGACSGLDSRAYFDAVRAAHASVRIPDGFASGNIRVQTSAASVRDQFLRSNPDLERDSVVLRCEGQYLAEVQVCMDRGFHARSCGAGVRSNCRGNTLIVRPLR